LYYYNARWYDADNARFISQNPVRDPNNWNLYIYCANNPLINVDLTGKATWSIFNLFFGPSPTPNPTSIPISISPSPAIQNQSTISNIMQNAAAFAILLSDVNHTYGRNGEVTFSNSELESRTSMDCSRVTAWAYHSQGFDIGTYTDSQFAYCRDHGT